MLQMEIFIAHQEMLEQDERNRKFNRIYCQYLDNIEVKNANPRP